MSGVAGRRRNVRISDVAAAAGVSKALVSYALNDRPGVSDATRARIVEIAASMGWTPSMRARSLSSSRAYAIGLVLPLTTETLASDEWTTSLMAGIHSVLGRSNYALVTEVVTDPEAEIEAHRKLAVEGRVDGMVLLYLRPDDPRLALLTEHGMAYVCLNPPDRPTTMPVVDHDERQAASDVIAHLTSLGHTRIAHVAGPQSLSSARLRRELYQESLRSHGLDDSWWVEQEAYSADGGRAATHALLDDPHPPTAIVYFNDLMAIAGMGAAFSRGLRVPEDLSVVGWDDIAVARYLHPALSTVTQDPYGVGRESATLLLEAIDGREFTETCLTADPVFTLRESTAPAPSR